MIGTLTAHHGGSTSSSSSHNDDDARIFVRLASAVVSRRGERRQTRAEVHNGIADSGC
jgi:hypothetical protein